MHQKKNQKNHINRQTTSGIELYEDLVWGDASKLFVQMFWMGGKYEQFESNPVVSPNNRNAYDEYETLKQVNWRMYCYLIAKQTKEKQPNITCGVGMKLQC